jgi:hypothetical protein
MQANKGLKYHQWDKDTGACKRCGVVHKVVRHSRKEGAVLFNTVQHIYLHQGTPLKERPDCF